MTRYVNTRLAELEKRFAPKPKFEVSRPGNGWVYLYWGNRLVKVLKEGLWDTI
jgi:hypothetical protein